MAEPFYVVVDGSNLATEGRTEPSLAQLDEAVRSFADEHPEAEIIVVVDANFAHRIAPAERDQLEQAHLHGELVWPPAGTVGRGDAFVLRIAERIGGVVLSNDSFQEFQEEHPWLFEAGRLVGGKPVPGVGWIFAKRIPVRAPRKPSPIKKIAAPATRTPGAVKIGATKKAPGAVEIGATKKAPPPITAAAAVELALAPAEQASPTKKTASTKKATSTTKESPAKKSAAKKAEQARKAEPAKKVGAKKKTGAAKEAEPAKKAEPTKKVGARKKAASATEASAEKTKPAKRSGAKKKATSATKASTEETEPTKKATPAKAAAKGAAKAMKAPAKKSARAADGDRAPSASGSDGARRKRGASPEPVNEALPFITFAAEHPLGSSVEGEVTAFTSHGAMVDVPLPGGELLHCYIPLSRLADPPPRRAREVLRRGERRMFVLVGLDPARRAAELGISELVAAGGHPDPEEGT